MDNAALHTEKVVSNYLCKAGFIIVLHPPYSPDLAPNVFFFFFFLVPYHEKAIKGQRFVTIDALISVVHTQFNGISQNGLTNVFELWRHRWEKCIALGGELCWKGLSGSTVRIINKVFCGTYLSLYWGTLVFWLVTFVLGALGFQDMVMCNVKLSTHL